MCGVVDGPGRVGVRPQVRKLIVRYKIATRAAIAVAAWTRVGWRGLLVFERIVWGMLISERTVLGSFSTPAGRRGA